MAENFNIEIISPEFKLLAEKVNSVTIPGYEGDMTILKDHIPVITFLRPGIIEVSADKERKYFVEEGTVEFFENNLSILSSTISELSKLTKEHVSKMIDQCKDHLNKENLDDKKRYIVSHKLDCLTRISL
jgi:F-type H+-transporting ATPase subunit epsilon